MRKILIILFTFLTVLTFGQKGKNKGLNFDIVDFNKKMETAEWLFNYDLVAWWTSDSVMVQDKKEIEKLGKEWFCFKDNNHIWHAIYGKYENNNFNTVFHYTVDTTNNVKRTYDKVDTLLLNSYSRALITANNQLLELKDTVNIRFNQFVRQNEDKTFSVWILPAFQTNGVAVYGGEFIYTIDQTGNNIIKDNSYYQGNFRGFKADNPREIWLNYREKEKPTLGAIFFVWYYKPYFTKIFIDNSKSVSTVIKSDNKWIWMHTEKKSDKKKRKNKNR